MSDDKDKNENVVIAVFMDEDSANEAIEGLKQWDRVNDEIKLGAIGTITKEGDKVKTHVGRKVGKGVAVGATVGVIAAALTGGAALIGGAVVAGTLGGVTGGFFKQSLHLSKEEVAQIGDLDEGKVAVVVTCDDHEIEPTTQYLTSPRSKVRAYKVPGEALQEVADTLEDVSDDAPSEDTSSEASDDEGEGGASA